MNYYFLIISSLHSYPLWNYSYQLITSHSHKALYIFSLCLWMMHPKERLLKKGREYMEYLKKRVFKLFKFMLSYAYANSNCQAKLRIHMNYIDFIKFIVDTTSNQIKRAFMSASSVKMAWLSYLLWVFGKRNTIPLRIYNSNSKKYSLFHSCYLSLNCWTF